MGSYIVRVEGVGTDEEVLDRTVPASSISEQLLLCTEKGFQGGHVFKARRLLYHSSLGRE